MSMTKKHFKRGAEIVCEFRAYHNNSPMGDAVATHIEEAFIELFSSFNERFNVDMFKKACKDE